MTALRPKSFWERNSTWLTLLLMAGLFFAYLHLFASPAVPPAPEPTAPYLTFGSGKVNGSYFPVVSALAGHFNNHPDRIAGKRIRIRCDSGSVSTVREVISGRLDFGVAQSAVLYDAVNGIRDWAPYGRMMNLRSVCTMASKELTIVARADLSIRSTSDLGGMRVNIGDPGTGTNSNARQLLDFLVKNGRKAPGTLFELSNDAALAAFREGRVDALVTSLTHPSRYLQDVFRCGVPARLVSVDVIDEFIKDYPYFAVRTLPAQLYPEAQDPRDLRVISTPTILFTTDGAPTELVKDMMSEIIMNLRDIKEGNPELQSLQLESLLADNIIAGHSGALEAFYEAGMLHARADSKRSSLMAVSFRRNDPLAEPIAAALCDEVNSRRIPDLRLVLLVADGEQETVYRVVSGIARFGFANAYELRTAAEGEGVWKPMGPLRGLAALARVYDLAIFQALPVSADGTQKPYLIPGAPDVSQVAALKRIWKELYPSAPEPEVRPLAEAAKAYAAGQAGLLLTAEVRGDNPAADMQAWFQNWERLRKEYGMPPLRLRGVEPKPQDSAALPWLAEVTVPIQAQALRTASIPVMFFTSAQASQKRVEAALQAMAAPPETAQAEGGPQRARRFAYMASHSPLPFHPAVAAVMQQLSRTDPALAKIRSQALPLPAMHQLTIAAPSGNSGQFMAAGMVAYLATQPRSVMAYCTTAVSEKAALDDIRSGRADLAIVSASSLAQAAGGTSPLRLLGSLYTVPLAFYADISDVAKSPLTMGDFIGQRVSAPDPAFPGPVRGLGITVFSNEAFLSGLQSRTLLNTEESDLAAAIGMYNRQMITGFFVAGLHPLPQVMSEVSPARAGRFIPITEGYRMVIEHPFYVHTLIPQKLMAYYAQAGGKAENIPSIGVPMMLVGTTRLADDLAGQILKRLLENVKQVQETHPAFADFEAGELLKGVAVAPLHPGALRFYQKEGFVGAGAARDSVQVLNLGTGSTRGSFFPIGVFLERMINARVHDRAVDFQITLEISDGSHQNCMAVNDRAYDLGISQADVAGLAYEGKTGWSAKGLSNLRAICNLQNVPLFCFVRKDSPATSIRSLAGMQVNVGVRNSGTWALAQRALTVLSAAERQKLLLEENDDSVAIDMLYAGGLDALFLSMSSSEIISRFFEPDSPFRPVNLYTPELEAAVRGTNDSVVTLTPATFPGLREEMKTVATPALLMTHKDVAPEIVRDILRAIIQDRATFPQVPPQIKVLRNEDLCRNLALPLHEGAKTALIEAGLLPAADGAPKGNAP